MEFILGGNVSLTTGLPKCWPCSKMVPLANPAGMGSSHPLTVGKVVHGGWMDVLAI